MHYFKMNIGDYAKKTGRLSMIEHGAYTLLIHACYDRERFPTLDEAFDWCWARTAEERDAVQFVLDKFFDLEGVIYIQSRIQEEIDKYHGNSLTNKRIAREREDKRREEKQRIVHEPCSIVNEPPPNQEPLTINHKPITINQEEKEKEKEKEQKEKENTQPSGFTEFWKIYPKATAKRVCLEMWKKRNLEAIAETILDDVRRKSKTEAWTKENGMYVPMSKTYLNQERWNDKQQEPQRRERGFEA